MDLEYDGLSLEIVYSSFPGYRGQRDSLGPALEPDEEAGIEIESIKLGGTDITAIFTDEQINEIHSLVIKELEDE